MMGIRTMVVGGAEGSASELVDRIREVAGAVSVVADGRAALQHHGLLEPDLVLIRRPLPGALDAFETCRALRARSDAVLVIVPDRPGPHDELVALAVGADHLLPADTGLDLAVARLRALVRRAQGSVVLAADGDAGDGQAQRPHARSGSTHVRATTQRVAPVAGGSSWEDPPSVIEDGDLEVDVLAREVRVAGRPVEVTRIEFDLLVALARNPRRVLTREQLMDAAWETPFDSSHVLDAHLSRLRCKVEQAGGCRVAHAVRGVGYRLRS
jgi:DNA-binding response OmpR family regulator